MHIVPNLLNRALPAIAAGLLAAGAVHAEPTSAAITEQRSVGAFNAIELSGPFDVAVRAGSGAGVALTGQRAQLEQIEVIVQDGTLVVRPLSRVGLHFDFGKRPERVTISIGAPQLTSLRASGSGDVTLDGINGERFTLGVTGPGDLRARISRSGDLDADGLRLARLDAQLRA